ncbi:hypothetical protein ES703_78817 [subsurface metagenome]
MEQHNHIFFEFKSVFDLIEKNIKYIEAGVLTPGDIVYCSKLLKDVVFLEGPSLDELGNYHKDRAIYETVPFPSNIKFKTFNGEIGECPVACIAKISSGSFFSSYEVKSERKGYKTISMNLEFLARANGFRVEVLESEKGYLLKFFGDSQEKVDQFVDCVKMVIK